jgi:hypothetical protein
VNQLRTPSPRRPVAVADFTCAGSFGGAAVDDDDGGGAPPQVFLHMHTLSLEQ